MTGPRRAVLVLAGLGVLAGALGLLLSLLDGQALLESRGTRVAAFHHLNPLGGIVVTVLSLLALAGALLRQRALVVLGGAGLALAAVSVPAGGAVEGINVLGGTGSTLSVLLGLGVGLLACAPVLGEDGAGGDPSAA
jgi:hypothetical protein